MTTTPLVSPLTLDRQVLRQRVNAIDTEAGDTKLYDAAGFALTQLLQDTKNKRRTAVVLMSDGLDGNIPGAILYQGYGQGRCNCTFSNAYPYSIAPRLGVAYQLDQKTVFRGGAGVTYAPIGGFAYITNATLLGVCYNGLNFPSPAFNPPPA